MVPGYWGATLGELGTDGTAVAELQTLAPGGGRQISSEGPEWQPVTTAQQPMAFFLAPCSRWTPTPALLYAWLTPLYPSGPQWPEPSPFKSSNHQNLRRWLYLEKRQLN